MSEPRPALFPARVTLPDGTVHEPARVATDTAGVTHAWVWDHTANRAVEVAAWPAGNLVRTDEGGQRRPSAYRTYDGAVLEVGKGCGCGHPLKQFRPRLDVAA